MVEQLCECGCGNLASPGSRFIHGHNMNLKKFREDATKASIQSWKPGGKNFHRKKHFDKPCKCGCGQIVKAPNKYIQGHHNKINKPRLGKKCPHTAETKAKMSKTRSTPEMRSKMSIAAKKAYADPEYYAKFCGPNSSAWRGGVSSEGYCPDFKDPEYRKWLFDRDNNECKNPYCRKLNSKLSLHHINHNKKDCRPRNFIAICISCNSRANFNIKYWERLYKRIRKYGFNPRLMFE